MIAFPNAKINLGLHLVEKRSDGYHNIETVFYPVQWKDALEIIPAEKKINRKTDIQFRSSGIRITGSIQKNSCVKAYHLLKEKYDLPPVQMHLHKVIPTGAGLGGGSSDATFAIGLLNDIFRLKLSSKELEREARHLGSDCAFFIHNKPVFASGKGDEFEEIQVGLSGYYLVIVKPDVHVNTASAYKNASVKKPAISLKEIIRKPVMEWKELLSNDFEKSIFPQYPGIQHIKNQLYDSGAVYAAMSGSGSAVFGIFEDEISLSSKFNGYHEWSQRL